MALPLRLDPDQRFSCSQCGRCCRRWEIVVSEAEVELFRRRGAARWFRDSLEAAEGATGDPFEPVPGWRGFQRIRRRDDGACGFLSADNRCRLHEELDGQKPLTCRVFPLSFHPTPDAVIVKASFGCPSVVANTGARLAEGEGLAQVKALRTEWFARHPATAAPRPLVEGRAIDAASLRILRDSLLQMLDRVDAAGARDLRANMRLMAHTLEDLTRHRVVKLPDPGFAEYLALTSRHAAAAGPVPPPRPTGRVGRLLQHGFLFLVAATRLRQEGRGQSRVALRLATVRLLAHFHRLAPGFARVDVAVLSRGRADVNAPDVQPVVRHYLQSSLYAMGAGERPVLDDLAIAVSFLNAACALAVMNARATGRTLDGEVFSNALMEAVELSQGGQRGVIGRALRLMAGGIESLHVLGSPV